MWTEQKKADVFNGLLSDRIQNLMPLLLRESGLHFWVVLSGEFNEDPVFQSLVPFRMKMAPRLLGFVFALDPAGKYHAWYLGKRQNSMLDKIYCYGGGAEDTVYESIAQLAIQMGVISVAADSCGVVNQADGLSHSCYLKLRQALPARIALTSAQPLVSRWLEIRTDRELDLCQTLYRQSMGVISEVYSADVLRPGHTTTWDLEWEICQRIRALGLDYWFAPDVDLQRKGRDEFRLSGEVILPGDLVHCAMGLTGMGICTDTQRNLYVGLPGEKEIPEEILAASRLGNKWQDILLHEFAPGLTGNQVFANAMSKRGEIEAMSYCHSVGFYGHGAGPVVGMFDNQGPVPGKGEQVFYNNTCHALECNIRTHVPEWDGQEVCIMQEETIWLRDGKGAFMEGNRDKLYFLPQS